MTSIVVIVTNQNMSKGMKKAIADIPVIAAIPVVRSFNWNTPIKPTIPMLKSKLSI